MFRMEGTYYKYFYLLSRVDITSIVITIDLSLRGSFLETLCCKVSGRIKHSCMKRHNFQVALHWFHVKVMYEFLKKNQFVV